MLLGTFELFGGPTAGPDRCRDRARREAVPDPADRGDLAALLAFDKLQQQRITWQPSSKVTFALHEMVVYSDRGIDLDYLTPTNPIFFSQLSKGDLDNWLGGIDLIVRPVAGTEVFGSLLVDDIVKSMALFGGDSVKAIYALGLHQRLLDNVQLGASYTRSDPFTYSHKFYLNGWEDAGRPLGQELPRRRSPGRFHRGDRPGLDQFGRGSLRGDL